MLKEPKCNGYMLESGSYLKFIYYLNVSSYGHVKWIFCQMTYHNKGKKNFSLQYVLPNGNLDDMCLEKLYRSRYIDIHHDAGVSGSFHLPPRYYLIIGISYLIFATLIVWYFDTLYLIFDIWYMIFAICYMLLIFGGFIFDIW